MPEQRQDYQHSDRPESAISISHLVHTLRTYLPAIALGMAAVMIAYIIIATAAYLLSPSQRSTSQAFRLDFKGADHGEYPNGVKFSTNEIVSAPILNKVFLQDDLGRFVTFADFSRSLIVLESNRALEALARDYQSRLMDPKLTPIDRERIQREYDLKLASISKGQYALHYMRDVHGRDMPDVVIHKVLNDLLTEWANFVANEQHVLEYRIAVISPEVVAATAVDGTNPVINTDMLRAKVLRVMDNLSQVRALPAAEVARTARDAVSLSDIGIRLDEVVRFRLEPLIHRAAAAGLDDRAETTRFLESQLSYDERQLDAQQATAEATRKALVLYLVGQNAPDTGGLVPSTSNTPRTASPAPGAAPETVMPQLSDTFLERLIQLTSSAGDADYRQSFADEYRRATLRIIPMQEAVAYHNSILSFVRTNPTGDKITRTEVDQQILATREEVRGLVMKMHEIYLALSRNLNPSTELITRTGIPVTRVTRSISIKQLALYGVLTAFLTLPLLILISLIHNRVREEDEAEEVVRPEEMETA
jgi:hypothetical protein